jgi:hypothetical protein
MKSLRVSAATLFWLFSLPVVAEQPKILEVQLVDGSYCKGMPIHWDSRTAILLNRSGALRWLDVEQIKSHRLQDEVFTPMSTPEARMHLQSEMGQAYETLVAGPYVLAAPVGESARWRDRFLALLAGYHRYFSLRGWSLRQPDFPLVVIVFASRQEFLDYASAHHGALPAQTVGSYFTESNRCILYTQPHTAGIGWSETEATIVHEAVHQLAYNTGMHERLFAHPLWFAEGLATMFEQKSVYDLGIDRSSIGNRIHVAQLETLAPLVSDSALMRREISQLIESDTTFRQNTQRAYALAWGLTFFLSERMPDRYIRLAKLQARRGFGSYSSSERRSDFEAAVGLSLEQMATQLSRFLQNLR